MGHGGGARAGRWATAAVALTLGVFAVFGAALSNGFVDYDDNLYVTANPMVQRGLTPATLRWAFTTTEAYNWHPLTWISHLADVQLYGRDPRGHHLTSVALHAVNAVLFLLAGRALTGSLAASLSAAAVFALHPLRVESVAWVAERKDVLAAGWFLAALLCHVAYVRTRRRRWQLAVLGAQVLALLSKSTTVTLPFALLLLDVWPLGRWRGAGHSPQAAGRESAGWLLLEKAPLLLCSLAAAAVTASLQWYDAQEIMKRFSTSARVGNALAALVLYWGKTLWPLRLAHFYPHPGDSLAPPLVLAAVAVLVAVTVAAVRLRHRWPWVGFGWLWYLITVLPMIGIVQVAAAAMADRYTYLPFLGPALALGTAVATVARARRGIRRLVAGAGAGILVVAALLTHRQIGVWRDNWTLATHAVAVTRGNWIALHDVGQLLARQRRWAEATGYLRASVALMPSWHLSRFHLGQALMAGGDYAGAAAQFGEAVRIQPLFREARAAEAEARRLAARGPGR